MAKYILVDGVRYVRDDVPNPLYNVRAYSGPRRDLVGHFGPYHSLADATWEVRCAIERGAKSAVVEVSDGA